MNIAAVYVTYFPEPSLLERSLKAVSADVRDIIIVDNTDRPDRMLSDEAVGARLPELAGCNVRIVSMGRNSGIAHALNVAFREAAEKGSTHVLALDQDSVPAPGTVPALASYMSGHQRVGQVGPLYSFGEVSLNFSVRGEAEDVEHVITSGSLTSLEAYEAAGGFREDLFIDMVDVDFSIRVRAAGYRVVRLNTVVMEHHLGEAIRGIRLFGKDRLCYADHSPVRWYYITRNTLEIRHRFIWKPVLRMLLSGTGRRERLRYVLRGVRDYRDRSFGEYAEDR